MTKFQKKKCLEAAEQKTSKLLVVVCCCKTVADDVIHPADQKSWLDPQISLFDGLIGREGEGIRKEI